MKDEINLLPPLAKQVRMGRLYRRRLLYLARRALAGLALLWLVMGGIFWVTWQRQQQVAQELLAHKKNGSDAFQEIGSINALLGVINQHVDAHPVWSPYLDDVMHVVPASARLSVLALQAETGGLTLRGVAQNRTAVLDMQQRLEALPWVERVEAPLQNFASDPAGDFSFVIFRREDNHE